MDPARERADIDLSVPGGDGDGPVPPRSVEAELLASNERTRERLWWAAAALYRRRWTITAVTALVAIAAVAITLQLPNQYRAETRVLLPDEGGGLVSAAISAVSPAAAALLGGGGGGFTRYMAILTSPSTLEDVVERFDLVAAYDLEDADFPQARTLAELYDRAEFEVSVEYDYLAVSVLDEDPERAAQMANFFVERLNERNIEFQSSSAGEYRRSLQARLEQSYADLDSTQAVLQALQERSGVVQPEAQASALFEALASAQAEAAGAEVQYQALLSQYGPENTDVRAAAAAVEAARQQVARLAGGAEAALPLPLRDLPRVQREYAQVLQEVTIQQAVIETVQPLYEQARLQEQRDADAVQVLDPATPPARKAEPRRSLLVIGATLSAFLVAVAVTLLLAALGRGGPSVLARLRAEA
ncbi:Wzz/FepE/Etk N-terminal domain-containing protein [Rubrivirga sp. S365]|uniref:Wzz/FepE/Etk N-terminal domain-containing protein n=1 Tax=Rubrivirga litoralis TaxID=3075598 RepID=A0ABU3BV57_9BACT|nr:MULTISPECIES: Wzz/FepE/Etk N-terminal domain-containing protein [unclassified Rubrivirga]MDT0633176.1 Wzz/FepE/Etk N-terminal domain-containing protein [Rubrivirga sp. F394]MDT7858009.1 Wzz/FepE/Etk N-terminal domain-containing protein [Rubrivirga sp. S365]